MGVEKIEVVGNLDSCSRPLIKGGELSQMERINDQSSTTGHQYVSLIF